MITKVLVVDDDASFRSSIVRSLQMNDYETVEACDGKEALGILAMEKFDLILSDVKMPVLNGIEFLHRVKRENIESPFIMMTGFSEVIEIQEAYEIGADGFLAKPYRESDLLSQIQKIENPEEEVSKDDKYINISIDEFIAGASIKYPVYIKLEDGSFVKIANEGENLTSSQIEEFKKKGNLFFYLEQQDFKLFIDFNLNIKGSILRSPTISDVKKLKFIKILLNHFNKLMSSGDVDEEIIKQCVELKEDFKKFVKKKDLNLFSFLSTISSQESVIDTYSVGAMFAFRFAQGISWINETMENDLLFGALMQDVSTKFNQDHHDKEHPLNSARIIAEIPLLNKNIEQIVLHHHENLDGSGYPSGIKGSKINPIANLINFSNYVINFLNSGADFSLINYEHLGGQFRSEYIEQLKKEINLMEKEGKA